MIFPTTYAVFDTETTGLDPRVNSILQIACATYVNEQQTASMNMYLNWGVEIPEFITKINNIDKALIDKEGKSPTQVIAQFLEMTEGFPLIGHNIFKFDLPFMLNAIIRAGDPEGTLLRYALKQGIDTAAIYKAYVCGMEQDWTENLFEFQQRVLGQQYYGKKFSLSTACDYYGIDRSGGQHDAMKDVLLNAQLYQKMCLDSTTIPPSPNLI